MSLRTPIPPPPDDTDGLTMETQPNWLRAAAAGTARGRQGPTARLVVLSGPHPGRRYPLDEVSTLGREPGSTVPLEDGVASRRHARLARLPDGNWEITDLGSRNGTVVNGKRVRREPIRFGDRIQIGQTVYLFSHVDPLEERILHRQKLEAIGRLGAGIAHDINNILGGILMNAEFLSSLDGTRPLKDDEVVESLRDLRAAAALGADLTRRILVLARRGSGEHQQIDLSQLVLEAISLARRTFARAIRVEEDVAPAIHVRGDRTHLHQMMMNLLLNARDALPEGGTITVSLQPATQADVSTGDVAVAGKHVAIVVADNGVGMDAATKARVFEPFFTTKSSDGGSGLGLSTVLDVMTAHGGTVLCESEPGQGTKFRAVLPALVAIAREESKTPLATLRMPQTKPEKYTILVVDDEPLSRRSIARLMTREGHEVLTAADGKEAVAFFRPGGPQIDLVLMDLDMPELDGQGAQREMARTHPQVPVVILTGFVEDSRRQELIDAGVQSVLVKPCSTEMLRGAIASAIGMPRFVAPRPGPPTIDG
ncbi:MAG: response regulator [Sandaracinus sp.]